MSCSVSALGQWQGCRVGCHSVPLHICNIRIPIQGQARFGWPIQRQSYVLVNAHNHNRLSYINISSLVLAVATGTVKQGGQAVHSARQSNSRISRALSALAGGGGCSGAFALMGARQAGCDGAGSSIAVGATWWVYSCPLVGCRGLLPHQHDETSQTQAPTTPM